MRVNEKGFTLLESLFVLSIFLIISSFSILLKPHDLLLEKQLFFTQLKSDLLYAQQYAVTHQQSLFVFFGTPGHYYYIRKPNGEVIVRREYSDKITVTEGSQKLQFFYNSRGNLTTFGSIYIYIEDELYRMTFLIGRGRFYVVKE